MNATTNFVVQESKSAVVGEGQVKLAIARNDGQKGKSGKCIVVPALSIDTVQAILNKQEGAEWIITQLDALTGRMASALHKAGKAITVEDLNVEAMLAAMASDDTGSVRFTKESVAGWFAAHLKPQLESRLRERMPHIDTKKLDRLVGEYLEGFQILANRPDNRHMPAAQKVALIKALSLCNEEVESSIGDEIVTRLECITEASSNMLADLGV